MIFGGEGSFAIAPLTMKVAYKFEDFVLLLTCILLPSSC